MNGGALRLISWISLVMGCLALSLTVVSTARAHPASTYYPAEWIESDNDIDWRFGNQLAPLNTGAWRSRVKNSIVPWTNAEPDLPDFDKKTNNTSQLWGFDPCNLSQDLWVFSRSLTENVNWLGVEYTCLDPANSARIIRSNVSIDTSGRTWYTGTGLPTAPWDLLAVATHEMGHATGFSGSTGHFPGADQDLCPNTNADQTMCPQLGQYETHWRSLEDHDIHTVQNAYG